uniref:Large ribosomal subunit protein uL24c n=1 Tax=Hydropuntia rangiferina TaxID=338881 RepID=A0A345U8I7_9FLOR|nr:ribosomal protein L24 [Hydropuntia rangiferina]AXI96773.1 ribosomal protein L24 [Hydropuntia rangiferina]UAD87454.1 ribosomal protein L24 [Hydropuntia rangiferina]
MKIKKNRKKVHVKSGEIVKIISGNSKGKIGKIIKVLPKKNKIIIENLNIATKHSKAKNNNSSGQLIKIERAIDSSNVKLHSNKDDN